MVSLYWGKTAYEGAAAGPRWILNPSPAHIDAVADFGATGDGVTDDTSALQSALTAAAGGVCFIPPGTYICSDTLNVPANTQIRGAGKYLSSLKWADGTGDMAGDETDSFVVHEGLLNLNTVSNVEIHDLAVDCNEANQAANSNLNGMVVFATDPIADILVQNCLFKNVDANQNGNFGNGIRVSADEYTTDFIQRINIFDSEFTNINTSYAIQMSQQPSHCQVRGCRVYSCTHGIDWSTGFYNVMAQCLLQDISTAGGAISLTNQQFFVCVANTISNCEIGIICANAGSVRESVIANNYIFGESTSSGAGITIGTGSHGHLVISGNMIAKFAKGIYLNGPEECVVNGNKIGGWVDGCPIGIELADDADKNIITGNNISGASTNPILMGGSTTDNAATANMIAGSSGSISDSGTDNTTTGNF